MFDHRIGAVIALSLLIATPALVFADVERSRDDSMPRAREYHLTSSGASVLESTIPVGTEIAEHGLHEEWNGVDFPLRGNDLFAGADARRAGDGSGQTSQR
jgi:hypothetical protein